MIAEMIQNQTYSEKRLDQYLNLGFMISLVWASDNQIQGLYVRQLLGQVGVYRSLKFSCVYNFLVRMRRNSVNSASSLKTTITIVFGDHDFLQG